MADVMKKYGAKLWEAISTEKGMKYMSLTCGGLLALGSVLGVILPEGWPSHDKYCQDQLLAETPCRDTGKNVLHAVICLYDLAFSFLIILAELKDVPRVKDIWQKVDAQFHLLGVRRGKGLFYIFVGVLAYYSEENGFNVSTFVAVLLFIVGGLFMFKGEPKGLSDQTGEQAATQDTMEMRAIEPTPGNLPYNPDPNPFKNQASQGGYAVNYNAGGDGTHLNATPPSAYDPPAEQALNINPYSTQPSMAPYAPPASQQQNQDNPFG